MEETKRWSEGVVGFGSGEADLIGMMKLELDTGRALADIDVGDAHADRGVSGVGQVRLNRRQRRAAARRNRR